MDSSAPTTAPSSHYAAKPVLHQLEFLGSGGEYFRIWIVNLLLTIVTLGIYGSWAKVRRLRYFYGSTLLAGSSFEYHGEPKKILLGRAIAAALILPYSIFSRTRPLIGLAFLLLFFIALPFIVIKSRRFQMRMTSWRNIRFGFDGTYGRAARVYLGLAALLPLTLGLLFPYVIFARQRFLIERSRFGQTNFEFGAHPGRYYLAYLVGLGALIVSVVGAAILLGIIFAIVTGNGSASLQALMANPREILNHPSGMFTAAAMIAVFYIVLIVASRVPAALVTARITNEAFGNTRLGEHQLQSKLNGWKLARIYIGNLLLVIITLGLFAPWAKIRLLRYQVESTSLMVVGDLDGFVADEAINVGATGEELGDLLDIDFGL